MKGRALIIVSLAFIVLAFVMQHSSSSSKQIAKPKPVVAAPKNFIAHRDIPYIDGTNSGYQNLDLFVPDGPGPFPVVVWIHGGAWYAGDKNPCPFWVLAREGYAVVAINYRLSTQAAFPAQIDDCKAAIRWLRAHAQEYHLDPSRIAVWGHSAGGHLASLLGLSGDKKNWSPPTCYANQSCAVQAVVDWAGVNNLASVGMQSGKRSGIRWSQPDSPLIVLFGGVPSLAKLADASPISYAAKDSPPVLIVHGQRDNLVPFAQAQEFYSMLKRMGSDCTLETFPDQGHELEDSQAFWRTKNFLDQKLKR